MASATNYNVELRDKDGNLRQYLTPFVSGLAWEWRRIGGCGRATITVKQGYRKIEYGADDDIQIRIKSGATSKLVYRGWIAKIVPSLSTNQQVKLEVRGYFDKLIRIIVHDDGEDKIYTDQNIIDIVTNIVDTYVVANSNITKGTIDAGGFSPDVITFKTNVKNALKTLANLEGNVEYGVDENKQFFWTSQNDNIVRKFFIGNNVSVFERRINWDSLMNKIYFEGGKLANGEKYLKTAEAADSQKSYYTAESIVSNSSIKTGSVADQYTGYILKDRSSPQLEMRVSIVNTDLRLEDNVPIGRVAVTDPDYDTSINIWGTAGNGGSDLIWGRRASGGSNGIWGGTFSDQIDRIKYTLSNTIGRFNIAISFGGTISESSSKIKQIESILESERQK